MTGADLTEPATVVALDEKSIWVETHRQGTCNACRANTTCGQGLVNRLLPGRIHYMRIKRAAGISGDIAIGDRVELSVPEGAVLRSSILVYLLPLLLLIVGAMSGEWLWAGDPGAIAGGIAGLLVGFGMVRLHALLRPDDPTLQPRLTRQLGGSAERAVAFSGDEQRIDLREQWSEGK